MNNPTNKIGNTHWKSIFRGLNNKQCILILGPQLAIVDDELTLDESFAEKLIKDLEDEGVVFDQNAKHNLTYVGLRWIKGVSNVDGDDLRYEYKDFCMDSADVIPRVYRELAQLPFFLTINTSPNDFMHRAFENAGKKSQLLHYNYQRNQSSLVPDISEEKPVVYNLFGYYNKPESLVITKEDQLNFINGLLGNISTLPNAIMKHLDDDKIYLFLGFDMDTWHLPLLFHSLGLQKNKSSFYLNENKNRNSTLQDFYKHSFRFRFVDDEAVFFAKELSAGYKEWSSKNKTVPTEVDQVAYVDKPQPNAKGKVNLLIMTSSPKDAETLNLNEEINMIEDAHARSNLRRQFRVRPILDIRKRKMLDILLRQQPQIIHFSGHGTGANGLLFYDSSGYSDLVSGDQLAELFRQFNDMISCVVLNACYSQDQAAAIAKYIPNVIGTDNAIGDDVASTFSEGFYTALFNDDTYEGAFGKAMAHVGMQRFPEGGRPIFYKDGKLVDKI